MNDEEMKAIRMLEFIVNHNSLLGYKQENRQAIAEYIINLIEKQAKEIRDKDQVHEYDMKIIDEVKGEYVKLAKEDREIIEKKDKMIQEMVEHIYKGCDFDNRIKTKKDIKNYFEKKVRVLERRGLNENRNKI